MIPRRRLLMLAPLGLAGAAGFAFWKMLDRMADGKFDPHSIGNPMLGREVPRFDLPGIGTARGFSSQDLIQAAQAKPTLVNFFWSPCVPCAEEAETLGQIAHDGLPVWGIVWKDTPEGVADFLQRFGNPYQRIGHDAAGRVSIDFGVYGMPESFLIDRQGRIAWHGAGSLAEGTMRAELAAAVKGIA